MKEKNKKSFIKKYIILLIMLIFLTILATYITMQYIDKKESEEEPQINEIIEQEETKNTAVDKKYGLQDYNETYNTNSLKITQYYDINGKIYNENPILLDNSTAKYVNYIQIEGLKDKNIQNSINEQIKQKAYKLKNNQNDVITWVTANFSNILSINISSYPAEPECINIDLNTGNEIPLEKVFVSSAPLNSYLAEGLYQKLAWVESEKEEYEEMHDMNNYDTSAYEEKFLMIVNNYKKMKNNLKYNIFASSITIYGLLDNNIVNQNLEPADNEISINFLEHMDEIAIYKRYLTNDNIYEDASIGKKGRIALTPNYETDDYIQEINYGKIQDNIFVEEAIEGDIELLKQYPKVIDYIKNMSDDGIAKLKNQNLNNQAMFYQKTYNFSISEDTVSIYATETKTTCTREYFSNLAFKDFIRLKMLPRADVGTNVFDTYMQNDFPNMKITEPKHTEIYLNKEGQVLENNS